MYCESGERLAKMFSDVDIYYKCDWYLFPAKVQRILPFITMKTQVDIIIDHSLHNESYNSEQKTKNIY